MEQKYDLKELFLRAFVQELIKNMSKFASLQLLTKELEESEETAEEQEQKEGKRVPLIAAKMKPSLPVTESKYIPRERSMVVTPLTRSAIAGEISHPITKEIGEIEKPRPIGISAFPISKLDFLLTDLRVQAIECIGPNKNLLVKKGDIIQRTNIILTAEEIKRIIDFFSERTRIPLVGGVFKAALGDLIMTAVISTFVGNRFVIQKKQPFKPLWHH